MSEAFQSAHVVLTAALAQRVARLFRITSRQQRDIEKAQVIAQAAHIEDAEQRAEFLAMLEESEEIRTDMESLAGDRAEWLDDDALFRSRLEVVAQRVDGLRSRVCAFLNAAGSLDQLDAESLALLTEPFTLGE